MLLVLVQGRTGTMDPRMLQPPFSDNAVTYIVHRHNLRVCQSYCNAMRASLQNRVRLYVSVACDTAEQGDRASRAVSEDVRVEPLRENNLRKLQYLPTVLPMCKGRIAAAPTHGITLPMKIQR